MAFRPKEEAEELFSRIPPRRGERMQEEEEGNGDGGRPPGRVDLRRKEWASPWKEAFEEERPRTQASRPISVPESLAPELYEILVPEEELRDPGARYLSYFEDLPYRPLPRRGAAQRRETEREGREWAPEGRGGARPAAPPSAGPGPAPRGRTRTGPPTLDPGLWFDMNAVWNGVRQRKADSRFQKGTPVGVIQISPARPDEASRAADLLRFFRVPKAQTQNVSGKDLWAMLHEFMDELSYAMNAVRPKDIPGEVGFQAGRDGSFWLGYVE